MQTTQYNRMPPMTSLWICVVLALATEYAGAQVEAPRLPTVQWELKRRGHMVSFSGAYLGHSNGRAYFSGNGVWEFADLDETSRQKLLSLEESLPGYFVHHDNSWRISAPTQKTRFESRLALNGMRLGMTDFEIFNALKAAQYEMGPVSTNESSATLIEWGVEAKLNKTASAQRSRNVYYTSGRLDAYQYLDNNGVLLVDQTEIAAGNYAQWNHYDVYFEEDVKSREFQVVATAIHWVSRIKPDNRLAEATVIKPSLEAALGAPENDGVWSGTIRDITNPRDAAYPEQLSVSNTGAVTLDAPEFRLDLKTSKEDWIEKEIEKATATTPTSPKF